MDKAETDIQLVDLKLDSHAAFDRLYRTYREEFLHFGRRYLASDEDVVDVYQDAIIVLFERVTSGRLRSLKSSVKTYLFAIGKYLMIDRFKKSQRILSEEIDEADAVFIEPVAQVERQIELNERQQVLYDALKQLDKGCHEILTLYYYRRYDMRSIAHALGYKNANVVKSQKARCMGRLRQLFTEKNR